MSAFSKKQLRSRQSAPGPRQDTHCLALGQQLRFRPAQIEDVQPLLELCTRAEPNW
ncbi:hypothetical protein ACVI3U_002797 [Sinorhizobium medicae]